MLGGNKARDWTANHCGLFQQSYATVKNDDIGSCYLNIYYCSERYFVLFQVCKSLLFTSLPKWTFYWAINLQRNYFIIITLEGISAFVLWLSLCLSLILFPDSRKLSSKPKKTTSLRRECVLASRGNLLFRNYLTQTLNAFKEFQDSRLNNLIWLFQSLVITLLWTFYEIGSWMELLSRRCWPTVKHASNVARHLLHIFVFVINTTDFQPSSLSTKERHGS